MDKVIKSTLRYLFQEYLKAPNVAYSINGVTAHHHADPVAVSDHLLERNWIRERWVFQDDLVSCRITVAGIEEVDRVFIQTKLRQIIGDLLDSGGAKDLNEILQNNLNEYAINLDIVFQLEKLTMVKIEHRRGSIIISPTDYGKQFFRRKGNSLFALMSVT
jgi:hypothetical protein